MTERALEGLGAVVTGSGRGIGAAVARALAAEGASLVLAARTRAEIEKVAADLREGGARAWAVPLDVTDEEDARRLCGESRRLLGSVDILVNAAGVSAGAPLARITLDDWNRMFAVNATGTFLLTRELVPGMIARRWGRVVNVASIAGLEGAKYVAHYAAAKHAVVGFTRAVALELEGTGVTINALCPGYVDTPMTDEHLSRMQVRRGISREEAILAFLATTGQDRLLAPEEVAARVLDLCREEAANVNGRAIPVGLEVRAS